MQKHEIVMMQWVAAVVSLVLGLLLSFTIAGYPPIPFPAGIVHGAMAAFANPVMLWGLIPGTVLAVVLCWACREYLFNGFEGYRYEKFIRGTKMENRHQLNGRIRQHNNRYRRRAKPPHDYPRPPVSVAGIEFPTDLETQGIILVGSPGTGKSQAIQGLVAAAFDRDDRMVVVDPNGALCSRFYLPGDHIINPYDERCIGWSLFNEVAEGFDFERLGRSAIPPQKSGDQEDWAGFARDVLADTMKKMQMNGMRDVDVLIDLLVRRDRRLLQAYLRDTDSAGFFAKDADRATASIIFTLNKYIRPLRRIPDGDFSIREWMSNEDSGNIWITWREDQRVALEPTIPIWLDLVYAMILSEAPTFSRRLWVVKDELASIGRLNSFQGAMQKGRKHGLCDVGGIQGFVQLDQMLGVEGAKDVLDCYRSMLVLGGANAEATERASVMLGKHEVERHPLPVQGGWRNNTRERRHEPEQIVIASEISTLPDLQGYLKYGKDWPVTKVKMKVRNFPERVEPFIERSRMDEMRLVDERGVEYEIVDDEPDDGVVPAPTDAGDGTDDDTAGVAHAGDVAATNTTAPSAPGRGA